MTGAPPFKGRQPLYPRRPVNVMRSWPETATRAAEKGSGGPYLGPPHPIFSILQIVSPLLGTWIYLALGGHAPRLIRDGLSALVSLDKAQK